MSNGSEKPSLLGKGLELANGDLRIVNDDFVPIRDRDNFLQDLQVMIETPLGSDVFNVNYGFDLLNSISLPESVSFIKELIRLNIIKSLSLDDRVKEIKEVTFNDEPRFFEINPAANAAQSRDSRKVDRRWEAVVVLQTITDSEVSLSLEGRGR